MDKTIEELRKERDGLRTILRAEHPKLQMAIQEYIEQRALIMEIELLKMREQAK